MSRIRKILIGIVLSIPIVMVLLILALQTPFGEKRILAYAEDYVYRTYDIRLHGDSLDLNLFPLTARINAFRIYGAQQKNKLFLDTASIAMDAPYSVLWSNDKVINSLTLSSPRVDPQNLPKPRIQERSEGTFQIRNVVVTGGALQYASYHLEDIALNGRLEPNTIVLDRLKARLEQIVLQASGKIKTGETIESLLDYHAAGDAASLSKVFAAIPPLSGQVETAGQINGSGSNYVIDGTLHASGLSVDGAAPLAAAGSYKVDTASKDSPYNAVGEVAQPSFERAAAEIRSQPSPRGGRQPWDT